MRVVEVLFRQMWRSYDWYVHTYESEMKRSCRGWEECGCISFEGRVWTFWGNDAFFEFVCQV